jgi:hypothetical protein
MQQHEHRLMHRARFNRRACSTVVLATLLMTTLGSLGFSSSAHGAAPSPATQAEIGHLLDYLGRSKCEFYRNGTWHAAANARKHLEKKRDYLLQRSLIVSTEDFIDRAATASSMTGEKYQVQCKSSPAVPSGDWLKAELERYRSQGRAALKSP